MSNFQTIDYDALARALLGAGVKLGVADVVSGSAGSTHVTPGEPKCVAFQEGEGGVGEAVAAGTVGALSERVSGSASEASASGFVSASEVPATLEPAESLDSFTSGEAGAYVEAVRRESGSGDFVSGGFAGKFDSDGTSSESGGSVGVISERVRKTVTFGDFSEEVAKTAPKLEEGFFRNVVRRSEVVGLKKVLTRAIGIKVPKKAMVDLAICTYSAGAVPAAIKNGKNRLRSLATVGDSALTYVLGIKELLGGRDVESSQALRSRVTSNNALSGTFVRLNWHTFVVYTSGVDPATSNTSATAFEAILGVVALYMGTESVSKLLDKVKLFK